MEKRQLAKTGEELSVVGFGAIAFVNESPECGREAVARAVDAEKEISAATPEEIKAVALSTAGIAPIFPNA